MVQTRAVTVEEYLRFIALPENDDRRLEFVEGEIVEAVPNSFSSIVAVHIVGPLGVFVEEKGLGYVLGANGGFEVGKDRYLPDVSFISKSQQPDPPHETFYPNRPDLAVEVLSPTDRPRTVRTKIHNYTQAGTVVWVVDPEDKTVEVYILGQEVKTLRLTDTLDGGDVLPGFSLAVQDVFPR